jgi:hypothetical protein
MWLAGGLILTGVIDQNSRAVDRLLVQADPAATLRIKVLGAAETSLLLRYEAAELSRDEIEFWEDAQLALAAFFLFFMLFGTGEGKLTLALSLALFLSVIAQRFALSPEIASYGRLTDFAPAGVPSGYHAKLLVLQTTYFAVEVGKWIVTIGLAAILIGRGSNRRSKPLANSWSQFNVVDKSNHGHVDR